MNWSREFSRREKLLLVILAVLLLLCAYYFFVQRPISAAISDSENESASLSADIEILSARQTRCASMSAELDALKAAGGAAAVPDYDNLQQLMGFLNSVFGSGTPYELNIQSVEQPDSGESIVRRSMQMSFVSPSYYAARSIIEQLQQSPYCCQLGSMSITPADTSVSASLTGGAVKTSLTVTFYENIG